MAFGHYFNSIATEEYELSKPQKRIIPKLPHMDRFDPSTAELRKLGNFGMEFLKWIPKFEALYYAGRSTATPVDLEEGNYHKIKHKKHGDAVYNMITNEYFDELQRYQVEDGEMDAVWGADAYYAPRDNIGSIGAHEDDRYYNHDEVVDGYGKWRDNWVAGQHHRSGEFGPGKEATSEVWGGKNFLSGFKNARTMPNAWDWYHFDNMDTKKIDDRSGVGEQAYFIQDKLQAFGWSWDGLNEWAAEKFGDNKNFYDIIMTYNTASSYESGGNQLSAEESLKLTLLMIESRERLWFMQKTVFGDVTDTRNDAAMMPVVEAFVDRNVPNLNFISIALFMHIFRIQHSLTNSMTHFWGTADGFQQGHPYAKLDIYRFKKFNMNMGIYGFRRHLQDNGGKFSELKYNFDVGDDHKESGKLYDARELFSTDTQKEAVEDVIEEWFGALYPEYEKPVAGDAWEFQVKEIDGEDKLTKIYDSYKAEATDGVQGEWRSVPGGADTSKSKVFMVQHDYPTYGYDRKYNENKFVVSNSGWGGSTDVLDRNADWRLVHNHYRGESVIHEDASGSHLNYTSEQCVGLSNSEFLQGPVYNDNWVIHLLGELHKNSLKKGFEKVVRYGMDMRQAKRDHNEAEEEYEEAKLRVAENQRRKAEVAAREKAKQRQNLKLMKIRLKKLKQRLKELDKKAQAKRNKDKELNNIIEQKKKVEKSIKRLMAKIKKSEKNRNKKKKKR
jgi:hypothetical protein